jgi:threonyl-tRNA synthetase
MPVGVDFIDYAQDAAAQMLALGIRAEVDLGGDRLGKQIRNAEKAKIPVMAVVGEKEVEAKTLSVRTRAEGELGALDLSVVMARLVKANESQGNF